MTLDINDDSAGSEELETPSGEVEQDESSSEELAASEEDESQAAESESNEEEEVEETPKARSSKLQKLIDSKGGDEDKFAENLYSLFNNNKSLAQKLEKLEQLLEERNSEPEKEFSPDDDSDYKGFKEELTALDADLQDNQAERDDLVSKFNLSRARIAKYEGAMQNAEPFERLRLQEKIEEEQDKQDDLKSKWRNTQKADQKIAREKARLEARLKDSEEKAKTKAKQQQLKVKEDSKEIARLEGVRNSIIDELALEAGIDDPDEIEELRDAVRFKAAAKIQRSGPVDDFEGLIRSIAEKFIAPHRNQTFKQVSQQKVQASKPVVKPNANPKPKVAQAVPKKAAGNKPISAKEAEDFISKWANS